MKKIVSSIFLFVLFSQISFGQCTHSSSEYGGGTAPLVQGEITEMSTCNWYDEYGIITGLLSSTQYTAAIDNGGEITVFDNLGTVVAFGPSPLTFTPPSDGDYDIQWNGIGCISDMSCHITTVTNAGPSGPCSDPAIAGTTVSSVQTPCTGQPFALTLSGASSGVGMTYQWQSSADGITYSDISGEISSSCSTSQITETYYQCIVTCSAGTPSTSTPIQLAVGTCILMGNSSEVTCSSSFYDSGANNSNYLDNENFTLTITPSIAGTLLQISFTTFESEFGYDSMTVYNGNSTAAPLMGSFNTNPGSITSTAADGSLTLTFSSDGSVNYEGWDAQITCVTAPANDIACNAISIPVDGSEVTFNNGGASIEVGETTIAPPVTGLNEVDGWGENTLTATTWFTFIAPASGNVSMNCTGIEFDGQAAVYEATNCNDFSTFTFLSGNDNSMFNFSESPEYKFCGLTGGNTYYILFDSGNTLSSGAFSISLDEFIASAGTFVDTLDVCAGDSVILFDGLSNYTYGGVWEAELPVIGTGLQDSLFTSGGFAYQTFNFQYTNIDACAMDSIVTQVRIWGPSLAGQDGSVTACRNEPIDLFSGLTGSADINGLWYNPGQVPEPNSMISSANFQGSYNYVYIVSNGICPNDTSNVLVIVDGSCNYLSLEEEQINSIEIYPNPSNGEFTISIQDLVFDLFVEIKDVHGKLIQKKKIEEENGTVSFNLRNESSGIYLIRLYNESFDIIKRVVVE